jgi:hypothetical protein
MMLRATSPLTGKWYRAIPPEFWNWLPATAHAPTIPGRFDAGNTARPGFETLDFGQGDLAFLPDCRDNPVSKNCG